MFPFFKPLHIHQYMDNGGYSQDPERGTELNLVEKSVTVATPTTPTPSAATKQAAALQSESGKSTQPKSNQQRVQFLSEQQQQEGTPSSPETSTPATTSNAAGGGGGGGKSNEPTPSTSCRPEVCQRARERYTAPDLRGSPWHRTKTIFLLITIASLIIWAAVFFSLIKYGYL